MEREGSGGPHGQDGARDGLRTRFPAPAAEAGLSLSFCVGFLALYNLSTYTVRIGETGSLLMMVASCPSSQLRARLTELKMIPGLDSFLLAGIFAALRGSKRNEGETERHASVSSRIDY